MSQVRQVAIHLASGERLVGEVSDVPDDLDDDEIAESILNSLPNKPMWGVIAGVVIHSGAVSAIELL